MSITIKAQDPVSCAPHDTCMAPEVKDPKINRFFGVLQPLTNSCRVKAWNRKTQHSWRRCRQKDVYKTAWNFRETEFATVWLWGSNIASSIVKKRLRVSGMTHLIGKKNCDFEGFRTQACRRSKPLRIHSICSKSSKLEASSWSNLDQIHRMDGIIDITWWWLMAWRFWL